jgi:hypothetical protein
MAEGEEADVSVSELRFSDSVHIPSQSRRSEC